MISIMKAVSNVDVGGGEDDNDDDNDCDDDDDGDQPTEWTEYLLSMILGTMCNTARPTTTITT